MDVDARLKMYATENAQLRDRVDYLEGLLGHRWLAPVEWRLTASETRVFGTLLARDLATKDAIMAALYRDDGKDEPDVKIVDVFVCKLRAKVKPFGVEVLTRWGEGYYLAPETKAALS